MAQHADPVDGIPSSSSILGTVFTKRRNTEALPGEQRSSISDPLPSLPNPSSWRSPLPPSPPMEKVAHHSEDEVELEKRGVGVVPLPSTASGALVAFPLFSNAATEALGLPSQEKTFASSSSRLPRGPNTTERLSASEPNSFSPPPSSAGPFALPVMHRHKGKEEQTKKTAHTMKEEEIQEEVTAIHPTFDSGGRRTWHRKEKENRGEETIATQPSTGTTSRSSTSRSSRSSSSTSSSSSALGTAIPAKRCISPSMAKKKEDATVLPLAPFYAVVHVFHYHPRWRKLHVSSCPTAPKMKKDTHDDLFPTHPTTPQGAALHKDTQDGPAGRKASHHDGSVRHTPATAPCRICEWWRRTHRHSSSSHGRTSDVSLPFTSPPQHTPPGEDDYYWSVECVAMDEVREVVKLLSEEMERLQQQPAHGHQRVSHPKEARQKMQCGSLSSSHVQDEKEEVSSLSSSPIVSLFFWVDMHGWPTVSPRLPETSSSPSFSFGFSALRSSSPPLVHPPAAPHDTRNGSQPAAPPPPPPSPLGLPFSTTRTRIPFLSSVKPTIPVISSRASSWVSSSSSPISHGGGSSRALDEAGLASLCVMLRLHPDSLDHLLEVAYLTDQEKEEAPAVRMVEGDVVSHTRDTRNVRERNILPAADPLQSSDVCMKECTTRHTPRGKRHPAEGSTPERDPSPASSTETARYYSSSLILLRATENETERRKSIQKKRQKEEADENNNKKKRKRRKRRRGSRWYGVGSSAASALPNAWVNVPQESPTVGEADTLAVFPHTAWTQHASFSSLPGACGVKMAMTPGVSSGGGEVGAPCSSPVADSSTLLPSFSASFPSPSSMLCASPSTSGFSPSPLCGSHYAHLRLRTFSTMVLSYSCPPSCTHAPHIAEAPTRRNEPPPEHPVGHPDKKTRNEREASREKRSRSGSGHRGGSSSRDGHSPSFVQEVKKKREVVEVVILKEEEPVAPPGRREEGGQEREQDANQEAMKRRRAPRRAPIPPCTIPTPTPLLCATHLLLFSHGCLTWCPHSAWRSALKSTSCAPPQDPSSVESSFGLPFGWMQRREVQDWRRVETAVVQYFSALVEQAKRLDEEGTRVWVRPPSPSSSGARFSVPLGVPQHTQKEPPMERTPREKRTNHTTITPTVSPLTLDDALLGPTLCAMGGAEDAEEDHNEPARRRTNESQGEGPTEEEEEAYFTWASPTAPKLQWSVVDDLRHGEATEVPQREEAQELGCASFPRRGTMEETTTRTPLPSRAPPQEEQEANDEDDWNPGPPPPPPPLLRWEAVHGHTRPPPLTYAFVATVLLPPIIAPFLPDTAAFLSEVDIVDAMLPLIVPECESDQADALRRVLALRRGLSVHRRWLLHKLHLLEEFKKEEVYTFVRFACDDATSDEEEGEPAWKAAEEEQHDKETKKAEEEEGERSHAGAEIASLTPFSPLYQEKVIFPVAWRHPRKRSLYDPLLESMEDVLAKLRGARVVLGNTTLIYNTSVMNTNTRGRVEHNDFSVWLNIIAIIVIPLNVVACQWGMNCYVPGKNSDSLFVFWCIIVGMVVASIVGFIYPLYLFFEKK